MELSGKERKELRKAIINAYPDEGDLNIFIEEELEGNLAEIETGSNLSQKVSNLIKWAERTRVLKKLIEKAYEENPDNEKLKAIKEKLVPSIYDSFTKSSNFPENHWYSLRNILDEIDLNLLAQVCCSTLENSVKKQDISGNYPELQSLTKLGTLKTILLEKSPRNDRNIFTIIEFAERLAKQQKVKDYLRNQLNCWVEKVANELGVELPTYSDIKLSSIAESYLLVMAIPKGEEKFNLIAELFCDYNSHNMNKPIKLELEQDSPKNDCSWNQVIDKIYEFIKISKEHLKKYEDHNLTIELFLPLPYLDKNIDIEKISIGFDGEKKAIANEYKFVIRSIERITDSHGDYLRKLLRKWKNHPQWNNLSNKFCYLPDNVNLNQSWNSENYTWDEYTLKWDSEEILGLKITCSLPEDDKAKRELFIAIIRAGLPICLWTRCCSHPDIESQFNELFTSNSEQLSDVNNLVESVWKIRKKAHAKKDNEKNNYLGYHLGFLCDNPDRIPFSLTEQNQQLLETGQ